MMKETTSPVQACEFQAGMLSHIHTVQSLTFHYHFLVLPPPIMCVFMCVCVCMAKGMMVVLRRTFPRNKIV
eukprot:m.23818 g.23818  ORF g.23818 m.23818 type:complete len:71 (-) comp8533_c0_seq2:190-402(-)